MTEFIWNDELAKEYAEQYRFSSSRITIEQFKEKKLNKPLFKTHDGKDVFEGDRVWFTYEKGTKIDFYDFIDMGDREEDLKHYPEKHKYFSTKEAAEEYIIENQPLISLKEIRTIGGAQDHNPYYLRLVDLAKSKLK